MRILSNKWFQRFSRKERLSSERLIEAVARAEAGSIDADLGGGLIKQRVARPGGGRSGGYRTIIAWRSRSRAVFIFGFAKSERENMDADDLADLRDAGRRLMALTETQIDEAIEAGKLEEIEP